MRNQEFLGKTVLVTGGASGIGAATADLLAERGAAVWSVDINHRSGDFHPSIKELQADLTDLAQLAALQDIAASPDYLVNAAGISRPESIEVVSEASWDAVLDVNLKVPFFVMQWLAPAMPAGGAIVSVSSTNGKVANNTREVHYNAAKAGLIALTRTFSAAYADRGLRVNCVCPGVTDTPMLSEIFENEAVRIGTAKADLISAYLVRVPMRRLARAEEVAAAIVFLLSDDASYVTGQSLNVCGGMVTW